jgi:hypothetical protein
MLQAGRSQARVPMRWIFPIDLILPTAPRRLTTLWASMACYRGSFTIRVQDYFSTTVENEYVHINSYNYYIITNLEQIS